MSLKKTLKNKKYLLFDLAGTLVDLPIENIWEEVNLKGIFNIFSFLALEQKVEKQDLNQWTKEFVFTKRKLRKQAKIDLIECPIKEQILNFFQQKNLKISFSRELERQFILPELEISILYSDVFETLKKLNEKFVCFVITNNVSRVLAEETLKKLSLGKFFKEVIVSTDSGYRKPDVRFLSSFFKNNSSIQKDECTVIGDRLGQDILLAQNNDMDCIHIENDHVDNIGLIGKIKPTASIQKIKELEKLL